MMSCALYFRFPPPPLPARKTSRSNGFLGSTITSMPMLTGVEMRVVVQAANSRSGIPTLMPSGGAVGNIGYQGGILRICLGEVKSGALPGQLIAFARRAHEALAIKDRHLPCFGVDQIFLV